MNSDNISACWDVLCFADKAIIHYYALDSRNPLSISGICFSHIVYLLLTNYFGVKNDLIAYVDFKEATDIH